MNERIRVLVVDDQDLIRRGLTIQLAHQHKPDVVLMDIKMLRMNCIQATRAIAQALPDTQVVILTTYDTDDMVFEAIRAGAQSYLLKESSEAEALDVIHMVQQGESRMSPTIAHKILEAFRNISVPVAQPLADDEPPMEQLTERESEILGLIANGKTNQDIAARLFLTEGTVKNYVSKVMGKLHTNDRTQLAVKALRTGLAKLE